MPNNKPAKISTTHADGGCYSTYLEADGGFVCVFDGDEDIGGDGDTAEAALDAARVVHHRINTENSLELLGEYDEDDEDENEDEDEGEDEGENSPNPAESNPGNHD